MLYLARDVRLIGIMQKLSTQKVVFICLLLLLISTFYVNSVARGEEKEFVFTRRTYMEGGQA